MTSRGEGLPVSWDRGGKNNKGGKRKISLNKKVLLSKRVAF